MSVATDQDGTQFHRNTGDPGTSGWMTGNWLDSALPGEDLALAVAPIE